MTADGITKRRRKSPKRTAVIAAATEEFLTYGFSGTSMDRIAEAANVSKRTVYDHFPSKEDLFQAIADEILTRIGEKPHHEYDKEKPLEEQLLGIGHAFATTITDEGFIKLSRVVIGRFIHTSDAAHKTAKAHAQLRKDMIAFFKAGKRDGRLNITNPEQAATQFVGLIKEVAFWPAVTAGQAPITSRELKAVVNSAVEMFLAHYRSS
ncbi:MAG: TetR/AcrR family transcriptional regulator [Chloroflexota bacterium]